MTWFSGISYVHRWSCSVLLQMELCHCKHGSTRWHLTNEWRKADVIPARPQPRVVPTCRLRSAGAASFLALCWPSPRAWVSSSSNSCCRVASAGSEQPGKNQSSSISFVPQGKGRFGLDWWWVYGWESGVKQGSDSSRVKGMKRDKKCDGTDGVGGFGEEGDDNMSPPRINFITKWSVFINSGGSGRLAGEWRELLHTFRQLRTFPFLWGMWTSETSFGKATFCLEPCTPNLHCKGKQTAFKHGGAES